MISHAEVEASRGPIAVAVPEGLIRSVYYALIFSIPYEVVDLGLAGRNVTISKILGYLLILVSLRSWQICFRLPPTAFWCFAVYLGIYLLFGALQEAQLQPAIIGRFITLAQLVVLFWVSYNLLRYERIARGALLAFIASCNSLILLSLIGHGQRTAAARASAFGENPNAYGVVMALGLLVIVGMAYGGKIADKRARLLAWICCAGLAGAVASSGSRGATVALGLGLLVFLITPTMVTKNLKTTAIIVLVVAVIVSAILSSEFIFRRWERTIVDGDTAGRDRILRQSIIMFLEKPLVGWGPVAHNYELGSRLGLSMRDTHNLYFHVLHETGIVGGLVFFTGLYLCVRGAWRARAGPRGRLPLAIMCFLLLVNAKGTYQFHKLAWFLLAYGLSSASVILKHPTRSLNEVGARLYPDALTPGRLS
ncbi:O-antigen ligase family protein [Candidatus Nitrospira bockiana]